MEVAEIVDEIDSIFHKNGYWIVLEKNEIQKQKDIQTHIGVGAKNVEIRNRIVYKNSEALIQYDLRSIRSVIYP